MRLPHIVLIAAIVVVAFLVWKHFDKIKASISK